MFKSINQFYKLSSYHNTTFNHFQLYNKYLLHFLNNLMEKQKFITPASLLRKQYFPSTSVSNYTGQQHYLELLESKGLQINPKVFPSIFHLKNGLEYIGMAAKKAIRQDQVLIRVPEELILSSTKALEEVRLHLVYKDNFFIADPDTWEDRVIIVYCLYLLDQGQQDNVWFHMVEKFPKECDILCFWSEEELNKFKDKTVKMAAQIDLRSFQEEWQEFIECRKKYQILQKPAFSRQNYRMVFTNMINRSFGKTISFTSLAPFAELFNHHCSKTYYEIQKQNKSHFHPGNVSDLDESSSDDSHDSNDYIQQGQFAYEDLMTNSFDGGEDSFDLNPLQRTAIDNKSSNLVKMVVDQLDWQDFTILFVPHVIQKIMTLKRDFCQKEKDYKRVNLQLTSVQRSILKYKSHIQLFYKQVKKKVPDKDETLQKRSNQRFSYPKYKKEYQSFVIKTGKRDSFSQNNQIYFRYGRNSNRILLLRYGFALQGNKYEHVWISINVTDCLNGFSGICEKVMEKGTSLRRKFKIKHHQLNLDLIIFYRLCNWKYYHETAVEEIFEVIDLQKQVLVLQAVLKQLTKNRIIYEGTYDLSNKNLSYHEYFIQVYHLQKFNILQKQITLIETMINCMADLRRGRRKQEIFGDLGHQNRHKLKHYFSTIK